MTTMIERVARAAYDATKESDTSWDDEFQEIKTTYLIQARAAIEAMREPSTAMVDAAYAAHDAYEAAPEPKAWLGLISTHRAMIDAALSEKS